MLRKLDREICTILFLGLCFMTALTADFTMSNMQKLLNKNIREDKPQYTIDGNVCLGVVYSVYAIFLWFAPSCLAIIGPKYGLLIGGICLVLLVFSLTIEIVWTTYIGMVLGGIGGSLVWVSQGNYVILSSKAENVRRNFGMIWVFYSCAMIFGNLFAAFKLKNKVKLDSTFRHTMLYELAGVSLLGCFLFTLLPAVSQQSLEKSGKEKEKSMGFFEALKKTWNIFCRVDMLLLLITFCYVGFQQSLGQGIYASCIGFTEKFGQETKELVPLAGLSYGVGDLAGGFTHIALNRLLGKLKVWSSCQMVLGFLIQSAAFAIMYLNIPNNTTFGETSDTSIIKPRAWLALMCSIFLGIGDSWLNVQILPLLAKLEPDYSAQTCALFKFTKSMAMAVNFFLSSNVGLHPQIIVVFAFGVLGTTIFIFIDQREKRKVSN